MLGPLALAGLFGGLGDGAPPFEAAIYVVVERVLRAGWPVALYLASAAGVGIALRGVLRPRAQGLPDPIDVAIGLACTLWATHLLGVLGGWGHGVGPLVAWGVLLPGVVLLVRAIVREAGGGAAAEGAAPVRAIAPRALAWCLGLIVAMLIIVAACSPPGWLWASEGRGYDSLSYHLQLPQEWLTSGRLWPSEHNVYSYLPGYIEGAFAHEALLAGAGRPGAGGEPWGLLADEGRGAFSAQFFSCAMALLASWTLAHMLHRALAVPRAIAGLLGVALLALPWVVVTASLSYNDVAVLLFFAGACAAAMDASLSPAQRGAITGLLVGAACSCKPTALLFVGAPVGLLLLAQSRRGDWGRLVATGSVTGLAMIAPWLVRNALACGNPVFPFAVGLFGRGHWSAEQVARYAHAHHFAGSILDRVKQLALVDPADPAGPVHRGMLHPQWSIFFPLVLVAAVAALVPMRSSHSHEPRSAARSRAIAFLWFGMLAVQVLAWLSTTHLQSRFLLPLAVPGLALIALAMERMPRLARVPLAAFVPLALAAHSVWIFAHEPRRPSWPSTAEPSIAEAKTPPSPNALLAAGTMYRTGEIDRAGLDRLSGVDRERLIAELHPEAYANLVLPRETGDARANLLLVGSATPFYFTRPVVYSTTWDDSPIARAMRASPAASPGDAAGESGRAWAAALRARGVRFVLADFAELDRLTRSGFRDPALDPALLHAFLEAHSRPLRTWPSLGAVLVELK